jgi:hypothetical protein
MGFLWQGVDEGGGALGSLIKCMGQCVDGVMVLGTKAERSVLSDASCYEMSTAMTARTSPKISAAIDTRRR